MFPSANHLRYYDSSPLPSTQIQDTYILFFITGNPGLIEYYRTFLSHLYALLSSGGSGQKSRQTSQFQVFGRDLSGFEIEHVDRGNGAPPPYGLQTQIEATEEALETLVHDFLNANGHRPKVILIGHSVGAYILLELLRRHRENLRKNAAPSSLTIIGGICLFPTVTHIAQSRSGKQAGFLLCRPNFARTASFIAKLLLLLVPNTVLRLLIRIVMGFPADAAAVTAAFVKSKSGVRQALHMARDEMLSITTDAWDEEVWGASHPSPSSHPRAQLRFLFGKEDHWVADETRDNLIRTRAYNWDGGEEEEWKPKMEVDEVRGWPHAFCIRHSVPVAERVAGYVRDIIDGIDKGAVAQT